MKVSGQITIKVDGDTILAKNGEVDFSFGGLKRESKYADNRRIGYSEEPIAATVQGTLIHTSDTDLQALADHANVSIVLELDTGVKYLVANACAIDPPALSGKGDLKISYEGDPAKQL